MALYLLPFALSTLLAVLYELKALKLSRSFYGLALLSLALFAGLRFEVGQDWDAYEALFDRVDLNANIIGLYSDGYQQFEIGYYLLNYAVKALGGTYSIVFLIISLFTAYAFYKFTKRFAINRFYILASYLGYSYLLINFAQVRQAIAIGFFLLGCDYYLCRQKKIPALTIASIGVLFQYTSIMYSAILAATLFWPKKNQTFWMITAFVATAASLYVISQFTDFYSFVALIVISETSALKVSTYEATQEAQGVGQLISAAYLSLMIFYLSRYLPSVRPDRAFIVRYAILSSFVAIIFVVIFPGTYAFYSRILLVGSIFQAYAVALVFSAQKPRLQHTTIFIVTLAASASYLYRLVSLAQGEYLPYKSFISFLNF